MENGITYTLESNHIDKDDNVLITTGTADLGGETVKFELATNRKLGEGSVGTYAQIDAVLTVSGKDFNASVKEYGDIALEGNDISKLPDNALENLPDLLSLSEAEWVKIRKGVELRNKLNALWNLLRKSVITYWGIDEKGNVSDEDAEFLVFTRTYVDGQRDTFVTEGKASVCEDFIDFKYEIVKAMDPRVSVYGKTFKVENFQLYDTHLDGNLSGCPCSKKELEDKLNGIAFMLNANVDSYWRDNKEAHAAYKEYFGSDWVPYSGYAES